MAPAGPVGDLMSGRGAGEHLFMACARRPASTMAHPGLLPRRSLHVALLHSVHRAAEGSRTVVVRDITAEGPDILLG